METTIAESDPITVSITGSSSVVEGSDASYTVSLSPTTATRDAALKVDYATEEGTAKEGSDYTAASGTLTFAVGETSETVTVKTTDDKVDETAVERFSVTLSNLVTGGAAASLSSTKSVTTTITDNDGPPDSITLSVNPDSVGEDDGQTNITVKATLVGGSTLSSSTTVTIGALAGTATKDTDYAVNTALTSITIPANASSGKGTLTITPTDDSVVEGDETITVSGTATGFTVSSADITLTDDEKSTTENPGDKDSATLSISGPSANVAEGSNATFTVTLSKAVAKQVKVAWTATRNTNDYFPGSGTVTFPPNSAAGATQTITITATDDELSETAESFMVNLGDITSDLSSQLALKTGASSAQATIAASDPITVSISGVSTVGEGNIATYTVSISGGTPTDDLTVQYATEDGTATAAATTRLSRQPL